ncbi:MAG: hypothetical protein LBD93_11690 [Treponema sp.]|jgi:hypothetical protein|nr:hypothetical protein [Treponema sp.]
MYSHKKTSFAVIFPVVWVLIILFVTVSLLAIFVVNFRSLSSRNVIERTRVSQFYATTTEPGGFVISSLWAFGDSHWDNPPRNWYLGAQAKRIPRSVIFGETNRVTFILIALGLVVVVSIILIILTRGLVRPFQELDFFSRILSQKGFVVVAAEIWKLSETTANHAKRSGVTLLAIKLCIGEIAKLSGIIEGSYGATNACIQVINRQMQMKEIRQATAVQDTGSAQVLQGLTAIGITKQVRNYAVTIKQEAGIYLGNAKQLTECITPIEPHTGYKRANGTGIPVFSKLNGAEYRGH